TGGLTQLLMLIPVGARGLESVRSIAEVLQEPDLEHNEGRRRADAVAGRVVLDRASHRYDGAKEDALHDIDLEIRQGETIALVGSSGSGKSTLLNLTLGFVRPHRGTDPARRIRHAGARSAHRAPIRLGGAAGVGAVRGDDP